MASGLRAWMARLFGGRVAVAQAQAEAQLAQDRLRVAIEALPEGIVFLDAEGRYVLWNKRYAEIYHRSADLFAPGVRLADALREGVRRGDYPEALGREEAWIDERVAQILNPSGNRSEQHLADGRWLMIDERRTPDGGVIGIRVDITDMKHQAEALEQALNRAEAAQHAKNVFLADMSHALRTPLNGVLGLAQALEGTATNPDQLALLADLRRSAAELDQLVTDLLDYGPADLAPDVEPPVRDTAQPLRVLAADDNATNRRVISLILEAAGCETVTVEDGHQAVEAWREGEFDVLLMDLRMPVLDGAEAIRAIRAEERRRGLSRTPLVVLSANTSPEDRAMTAAAGADGHVAKPIRVETLLAAMEAALANENERPQAAHAL
jgi:CheY-like chemotaxis protein